MKSLCPHNRWTQLKNHQAKSVTKYPFAEGEKIYSPNEEAPESGHLTKNQTKYFVFGLSRYKGGNVVTVIR